MIRAVVTIGTFAIPMLASEPIPAVPEPSTILLMGGGLAVVGLMASRRNRKK